MSGIDWKNQAELALEREARHMQVEADLHQRIREIEQERERESDEWAAHVANWESKALAATSHIVRMAEERGNAVSRAEQAERERDEARVEADEVGYWQADAARWARAFRTLRDEVRRLRRITRQVVLRITVEDGVIVDVDQTHTPRQGGEE